MINMGEFFELVASGAISTYRGEVDVLVDKPSGLTVIGQGERLLVLDIIQVADLVRTLINKVGGMV